MKTWIIFGLAGLLIVAFALSLRVGALTPAPFPPPAPKPVPIEAIAGGEAMPQIGLAGPFPGWAPLPDKGLVTGAEIARAQPPYGASAVLMLKTDETWDAFLSGYRRRLDQRGYSLRRMPIQPNLIVDAPVAQYQADERQGGHVVYVTFRGDKTTRYVQLTYWSPPAPRVLP
jgi:hypothetical protein